MSRIHMFMAGAAGFYMMLAPFGAASAADEPVHARDSVHPALPDGVTPPPTTR